MLLDSPLRFSQMNLHSTSQYKWILPKKPKAKKWETFQWSSQSPDLHPTEPALRLLKEKRPTKTQQLKPAALKASQSVYREEPVFWILDYIFKHQSQLLTVLHLKWCNAAILSLINQDSHLEHSWNSSAELFFKAGFTVRQKGLLFLPVFKFLQKHHRGNLFPPSMFIVGFIWNWG